MTSQDTEWPAPHSPDAPRSAPEWALLWWVVTPFWAFMLASRMFAFNLATAVDERIIIAPPHLRVVQHLVLLPLLVVFLRHAIAIGWPAQQRLRAFLLHAGMAGMFAFIARPVLVGLVAARQSDTLLLNELFRSIISPEFSLMMWISTIGDFLLSYLGALFLVLAARSYRDAQARLTRAQRLETEWIRGRLNALQLRGNPQFLFNVLRDASHLIDSHPAQAREMLLRLTRLLQRSLASRAEQLVPLRQEFEAAREYIELQRLRFPGRLTCEFHLAERTRDCLLPSQILQPLVEDLLVRAQRTDAHTLALRVAARRDGCALLVEVNSVGAPGAGTELVRSPAVEFALERLRALFGQDGDIQVLADPQGCGTRLRLPDSVETAREPDLTAPQHA